MIDLGYFLNLCTAGVSLWGASCRTAKEEADLAKSHPAMGPARQPWEIAIFVGSLIVLVVALASAVEQIVVSIFVFVVLALASLDERIVVAVLVFLVLAVASADRRSGG